LIHRAKTPLDYLSDEPGRFQTNTKHPPAVARFLFTRQALKV
jgi:hypothetical protein